MKKKRIVIGNWKTNKNVSESCEFVRQIRGKELNIDQYLDVDIVLTPTFFGMDAVRRECAGSRIILGAQNVDNHRTGAFCGGFTAEMIKEYCRYSFVGHSEQRLYYGDSDELINQRVHACLEKDIIPVFCLGETRECYERGETISFIEKQLKNGLKGVRKAVPREIVILYEPVWALGTGVHPKETEMNETIGALKKIAFSYMGDSWANTLRFVYAGSIQPDNAPLYISKENIDGLAVGNASLDPEKFAGIVRAVSEKSKTR